MTYFIYYVSFINRYLIGQQAAVHGGVGVGVAGGGVAGTASSFSANKAIIEAAGFKTFPMVEFEADDALASLAHIAREDSSVSRVLICSPDKDLAQCVTEDGRVAQFDRRQQLIYDVNGVKEKFGVKPDSIPDFLALVGDSADGIPGLPGWGAKSSSVLLAHYEKIENIPLDSNDWDVSVRGAAKLAETLSNNFDNAQLYKTLTILRKDIPLITVLPFIFFLIHFFL